MKRILIVSRDISLKQDGGTLVSKRNERLLNSIGYITERFIVPIPSLATRIANIALRQSYGSTQSLLNIFKKTLSQKYDYIFFDGSIYGGYLKKASQLGYKTICFYHNVEAEYYRQKANQTKSIADRLMVPYIRHNEKLSTKYSNGRITLNTRDAKLLYSEYGKATDIIMPTSLPSRDIKSLYSSKSENVKSDPFLLFVGTNFFANYEGLSRFITNVAPKINCKVKVVGNIKDAFSSNHIMPDKIEFVGRVDNLDEYYLNASAVIAPIFSGSGLKTKTVEAISYGKTVIGYPEAFEGIEYDNYPGACVSVNSDAKFIEELNSLDLQQKYNIMSEKLFHDKLSDDAQLCTLQRLFDTLS